MRGSRRGSKLQDDGLCTEGYLEKLGGGKFKRWQRRWFSLRGDLLFWYDDENAPTHQKLVQISARIVVNGPSSQDVADDAQFEFSVAEPGNKDWQLRTTGKYGKEWLKQLSLSGATVVPGHWAASETEQEAYDDRKQKHLDAVVKTSTTGKLSPAAEDVEGRLAALKGPSSGDDGATPAVTAAAAPDKPKTYNRSESGMVVASDQTDHKTLLVSFSMVGEWTTSRSPTVTQVKVPSLMKKKEVMFTERTTAGKVIASLTPWLEDKEPSFKGKKWQLLSDDENASPIADDTLVSTIDPPTLVLQEIKS